MNIIFGREQAAKLGENYTVLELDTIRIGPGGPELTAFCVVESIPIIKMSQLDSMKALHNNMIVEYKKRNWNYCNQALEHLVGFWGEEVDTFYVNFQERVNQYSQQELDDSWDGIIQKLDAS